MTAEEAATLARNYLYAFPKVVSGLQCPPHIKFISDKIQEKIEDKEDIYKLLLFSCPPRHGKSLLVSKHLPAWFLGKYPDKRVILTSYSSEMSDDNSDYAKNVFETWGPILWGSKPSKSTFNKSKWNTSKSGGCISAGVSGSITGFGADLFIIDDYFKGPEESESKSARDKLWEKWQGIIGSRLHPGALVIILATRWHSDDLIGRLIQQKEIEKDEFPFKYEAINLSAVCDSEKDPLKRKMNEALWPKRYNEKALKRIKKIIGLYFWEAQYQGRPIKRGGTLFKAQNFRYYTIDSLTGEYLCWKSDDNNPLRINKKEISICVIADPAIEAKKKNDPTGMHTWAYSRRNRVWLLLDRLNDRIEHQKINSVALNFAFRNNATYILVENEKLGKVMVKQSAGNDKIGDRKIPFKEIKTKGQDKYARATPMASYFENERVFLPKNAPWIIEYEKNLMDFPNGEHDEDADLTAYAASMEDKMSIAEILASVK
jgi:predicted phage terminase large subunit-like protein